ncbi:flagellar biosynthesis protein FliR [Arthrobacter sp. YC-RL1]|uniref:flagellar biosynthetic protein FliR n=1 Tax=Arthrobacter sp. YC-RL1 TaxID=1652545 RepID=UPI00063DD836|nr:flagellar biosynthetic protein FliR [Arthrobacter sp. YC-RL1]ALQ31076.1 flagellar biosynthetic protein FliR [Arthrobacter sp. YC-RL1]KLI87656.1 flagellar biosynthesis protein FliR [Arthrobacter sp. YC-RL1]
MHFTLQLHFLEVLMLAAVRITAFLMLAPPFSHNSIPLRIKGMLGVALALAVTPKLAPDYVSPNTAGYLGLLVLELAAGACMGFMILLVFAAVQSAGNLIDLFGGFSMAQGFDPQSMVNGAQFARFFHFAALALLVASDGYQLVLAGVFTSFSAVPLGAGLALSGAAQSLAAAVPQMFVAAVQIAGPLLVVLVLADFGLGLLTRAAPALNAFAMGFPLKIFITLALAGTVFVVLPSIVSALVRDGLELLPAMVPR